MRRKTATREDPRRRAPEGLGRRARKGLVREYAEAILMALLLALVLRAFVVQAFKIPSGSMKETLLIGDHILVNKILYRTWSKEDLAEVFEVIPLLGDGVKWLTQYLPFDYRFRFKNVKRGDVVVFKFPRDESRDFIKRVVGLPGERVEVRGRQVYINGTPLGESYARYDDFGPQGQFEGRERFGPVRVPEGHLFMMGDNRDNSLDSRAWGFLSMDKVKGEAMVVYWSWDGGDTSVRWSRLGRLLF